MLHSLLKIFGLGPVAPKRPPTARKRPAAVKPKPVIYDERAPDYDRPIRSTWEESQERKAAATVKTIGGALRVYARLVGQVGSRPAPQYVAAARAVLGERRWAYLQALTLAGKKAPMMSEQHIGDPEKEAGLLYGLDRDISFKMDVWEAVSALETAAFAAARRLGKEPAEAIAIPQDIAHRLRELKKMRARPLFAKGGEGKGNAGGGPDAPTPAADAPMAETPIVTADAGTVTEKPAEGVDPAKPGDDEQPVGPGKP